MIKHLEGLRGVATLKFMLQVKIPATALVELEVEHQPLDLLSIIY